MPKSPPISNVQIFGATIILRQLSAMVSEIEGVKKAEDIEAVHRMRVATRRLRSALPIFGPFLAPRRHENWRKRIRAITRALGAARDTDVQIEHLNDLVSQLTPPERAGVRRLLLRLRQRRREMQKDVLKALRRLEKDNLVTEITRKLAPLEIFKDQLDLSDPGLHKLADEQIQAKLDEFLAFEPYVTQPECVTELHAMRIAGKHLRYTLEFFAPLFEDELKPFIKSLRQCQDLLGAIHDADVWTAYLPHFIEEERQRTIEYFGHIRPFKRLLPGLVYYQNLREKERQELYQQFVHSWQEWQAENVWENLRRQVSVQTSTVELNSQAANLFEHSTQPEETNHGKS
ncbi:MAG: CHAD domain-containing protein [Chloroflexota bacterium]